MPSCAIRYGRACDCRAGCQTDKKYKASGQLDDRRSGREADLCECRIVSAEFARAAIPSGILRTAEPLVRLGGADVSR